MQWAGWFVKYHKISTSGDGNNIPIFDLCNLRFWRLFLGCSNGSKISKPVPSDAELEAVLRKVRLGLLLDRNRGVNAKVSSENGRPQASGLNHLADWGGILSLGEQQRLAFARYRHSKFEKSGSCIPFFTTALARLNPVYHYEEQMKWNEFCLPLSKTCLASLWQCISMSKRCVGTLSIHASGFPSLDAIASGDFSKFSWLVYEEPLQSELSVIESNLSPLHFIAWLADLSHHEFVKNQYVWWTLFPWGSCLV